MKFKMPDIHEEDMGGDFLAEDCCKNRPFSEKFATQKSVKKARRYVNYDSTDKKIYRKMSRTRTKQLIRETHDFYSVEESVGLTSWDVC